MPTKLTKVSYDTLNENKEGVTFMRSIEEMTIKEIIDELTLLREKVQVKDTLFGYDVEELLAVKKVLEDKTMTPEILSSNIKMYQKGWHDCYKTLMNMEAN